MDRNETINWLVANSDTWTKPGDRDILAALPDSKLADLRKHAEMHNKAITVANAAVHGFADGGKQFRLNPESGAWEQRVVENAADAKEPKKAMNKKKPDPDMEEEDEEEEEEELEVNAKPRRKAPQTLEDFINSAPTEVQNMLRTAQAVEQREKDKIIVDLLVNVAEGDREAHRQRLSARSIEELANDRALMPKIAKTEELDRATRSNRGQVANFADHEGNEDMLVPQTIDWSPVANGKDAKPSDTQPVQNSGGGEFDDQWLQSAPSKIRVAVKNAMAIEQREKDKIISEIVANIADEQAERRMVARLRTKSLEELRELAVLAPKKEAPKRPNYFGSAAPAPGSVLNNSSEDVLPLPRMEWSDK